MKQLSLIILFVLGIIMLDSCKKENEEPAGDPGVTATCTDGIQNGTETGVDCGGDCDPCDGTSWHLIANDPTGDAMTFNNNDGADATALHFRFDPVTDLLTFRITATNVSVFSSSPAADFVFGLPNGTDNGDPTGFHWFDEEFETPGHRTAYIYPDPAGSAPSTYTYNELAAGAANRIVLTHDQSITCGEICIDLEVDEANNWLFYTFNRTDIITDTEMGGETATIALLANLGQELGWNDNITTNASFTISTSIPESFPVLSTTPVTAITAESATTGGLISDSGDSSVSERGDC